MTVEMDVMIERTARLEQADAVGPHNTSNPSMSMALSTEKK
jgi:hypothetical protein